MSPRALYRAYGLPYTACYRPLFPLSILPGLNPYADAVEERLCRGIDAVKGAVRGFAEYASGARATARARLITTAVRMSCRCVSGRPLPSITVHILRSDDFSRGHQMFRRKGLINSDGIRLGVALRKVEGR
jgi:hypothetical protein